MALSLFVDSARFLRRLRPSVSGSGQCAIWVKHPSRTPTNKPVSGLAIECASASAGPGGRAMELGCPTFPPHRRPTISRFPAGDRLLYQQLGFRLAFKDKADPTNYVGFRRDAVQFHMQFQFEHQMGTSACGFSRRTQTEARSFRNGVRACPFSSAVRGVLKYLISATPSPNSCDKSPKGELDRTAVFTHHVYRKVPEPA